MPTWDKKRTSWNSVATGMLKKRQNDGNIRRVFAIDMT